MLDPSALSDTGPGAAAGAGSAAGGAASLGYWASFGIGVVELEPGNVGCGVTGSQPAGGAP